MKLKYFPSVSAEEKLCFDISEVLGGGNFGYVGEVFDEEKAKAIVTAVNSREMLVEALTKLVEKIEDPEVIKWSELVGEMVDARKALAQVEE